MPADVALGGHIKEVGTHSVKLKFAEDVAAVVSVVVVADGEGVSSQEEVKQENKNEAKEQRDFDTRRTV